MGDNYELGVVPPNAGFTTTKFGGSETGGGVVATSTGGGVVAASAGGRSGEVSSFFPHAAATTNNDQTKLRLNRYGTLTSRHPRCNRWYGARSRRSRASLLALDHAHEPAVVIDHDDVAGTVERHRSQLV